MMMISKRHVAGPAHFDDREAAAFGPALRHFERVLEQVTGALRIYTAAMGESHPHFHAHMVPRYATMPIDAKAWSVFDLQRAVRDREIAIDASEVARIAEDYRLALAALSSHHPKEPTPMSTQKITPFLWFDANAEEAMNYYVSIFKNSKVVEVMRYGDAGPGPAGSVVSATFELEGQRFHALNGGPHFKFTEAISLFVSCETQQEVDDLWTKLSAGGAESRCGWLKDKFGLSWQIIPTALGRMLGDKANRAMQAMLGMSKIDIAALEKAFGST